MSIWLMCKLDLIQNMMAHILCHFFFCVEYLTNIFLTDNYLKYDDLARVSSAHLPDATGRVLEVNTQCIYCIYVQYMHG